MEHAAKFGRNRRFVSCSLIFIIVIVSCWGISWTWKPQIDRSDGYSVARAFVYALKRGDQIRAKSLADPLLFPKIENWKASHKPFNCLWFYMFLNSGDILETNVESVFGECDQETRTCNYWAYGQCYAMDNRVYYYYIHDVMLSSRNGVWEVVNWGESCVDLYDSPEQCQ